MSSQDNIPQPQSQPQSQDTNPQAHVPCSSQEGPDIQLSPLPPWFLEKEEEIRQRYVSREKRKIQILYPVFREKQIHIIALRMWDNLTFQQKMLQAKCQNPIGELENAREKESSGSQNRQVSDQNCEESEAKYVQSETQTKNENSQIAEPILNPQPPLKDEPNEDKPIDNVECPPQNELLQPLPLDPQVEEQSIEHETKASSAIYDGSQTFIYETFTLVPFDNQIELSPNILKEENLQINTEKKQNILEGQKKQEGEKKEEIQNNKEQQQHNEGQIN